jgi:replication factor C small subunit
VKKPRLPTETDKPDWIETFRGRPTTLSGLTGKANDAACRTLQQYVNQFEGTKNLQDLAIICGPAGSGKTILAQIYVSMMGEDILDLPASQYVKWCMTCDAKKYDASNYHELWKKIKEFIEIPIDSKTVRVPFKVIVVDDADSISATHQNSMKALMDKNSLKLKWIFTAREPRKFIQYLQTKAVMVNCRAPPEKEALLVVLGMCYRFKIGYERLGIKALFELVAATNKGNVNLTDIVRMVQKCFLARQYISEDNVYVSVGKSRPKVVVSAYASIEPFPRCKICTLYPPCQHRTTEMLVQQAYSRRAELPERKGGLECREFLRTGACSIFNKHGHCSLDHPTRKVRVEKAETRCPICTIKWPCNHCTYSSVRNELLDARLDILRRLELLETLTQEEPPVYLITHLVDKYDDWEETLKGIKKFYVTAEKQSIMSEIERWVNYEYSTDMDEYRFKLQRLTRGFGELLITPLLLEQGASRSGTRGESRQKSAGAGGRNDIDGGASVDSSNRGRSKVPAGGGADDLGSIGSVGTLATTQSAGIDTSSRGRKK